MSRVWFLLCLTCAFVCGTHGQWPLGPDFYYRMSQLKSNINRKVTEDAKRHQVKIDADMARAQNGFPFGEGRVFTTSDGGLGYVYNCTDGSMTLYSLRPGSPPHGYMYHSGPSGNSFSSW